MQHRIIQVWDLPVRLFHWLLVALVVAALVSVKLGGGAMVWHGRFGQAILGLIVFRIAWGLIGSTTARFTHFVRGPGAIRDYLAGRWAGVGHNPLGALSVVALLGVFGFQAISGLFADDDIAFAGPLANAISSAFAARLTSWHVLMEWVIYGLIALHVTAVVWYVHVRRERLLRPMLSGMKPVPVDDGRYQPTEGGGVMRFALALGVAIAAVWATSGALLPPPPEPVSTPGLGW